MTLRQQLQDDLGPAAKARDRARVSVLRTTLAALANAEAVEARPVEPVTGLYAAEVARRHLTDEDVERIIRAERDELAGAAAEMHGLGQTDEAETLLTQVAILETYLAG